MPIYQNPSKSDVKTLLATYGLPNEDLEFNNLDTFFGCSIDGIFVGLVGVELMGSVGLLRSLVVQEKRRGAGYGKALVEVAERYAMENGVAWLYLLTNTAEEFFFRLGYQGIDRTGVPDAIAQTQEYRHLCPATATVMVKQLQLIQNTHEIP